MKKNLFSKIAVVTASATAAGMASAAGTGIDVSATVTSITDTLGPIGLIGTAVLGVIVAIKAFKWVRRAM